MREYLDSGSLHLPIPVISANTHARIEGYFRLEWKLAVDRPHLVAPDQARISAELISVGDDTRVWSETYDRTLDDVFKVRAHLNHLSCRKCAGSERTTSFAVPVSSYKTRLTGRSVVPLD